GPVAGPPAQPSDLIRISAYLETNGNGAPFASVSRKRLSTSRIRARGHPRARGSGGGRGLVFRLSTPRDPGLSSLVPASSAVELRETSGLLPADLLADSVSFPRL